MVDGGHGILPDQLLLGYLGAEVACDRAHVAVGELEPGAGEGVGELGGVLVEATRDPLVRRVHPQGHVGRGHHRRMCARRVVRVGHGALRLGVRGRPLLRAGRAVRELPLVPEQGVEVGVVPLDRSAGPGPLDAAGGGVDALAGAERVLPAQAQLLDGCALGLGADERRVARTVGLAEGVPAGDESDGLLVVHRHPGEGLTNVASRGEWVGVAVRPFRVHVDEPHLHRAERVQQFAVAAVALIAEPGGLRAPVDVLFGLEHVDAATGEAEGLEAHRLQRDVAGEHHQVGPGELAPVLLLDRQQQRACLVEVAVVGPAVERGEALRAVARATATVFDAVGAGAVPRHANEEGAVVTVVGRPPVL